MPKTKTALSSPRTPRRAAPILALLVCSALAAAAFGASPALASRNQTVFFEAGKVLLEPHKREHALAQLKHLGVHALRVELAWADVAPGARANRKPSFEATAPAAYNWSLYDWLLGKAQELKWPVLLTVTSPVPHWASANHSSLASPNAKDFEEFMVAVGKHYGSQAALFAIWNEPNDIASLQPQFNASGQPVSPRLYRALYQAGYAGLQAAGLAHPKVLIGETAPVGFDSLSRSEVRKHGLLHDVAPLAFLRGALCLDSHYRKAGACGSAPAYGYAMHAYTTKEGPLWVPSEPDDVTIGTLYRLENALNRAARAGAIRAGIPIYLTEFGVQSVPNRYEGVSLAKQAEYDALAEYIAWKNPRVAAFSQYLLHDDPVGGPPGSGVHGGTVGFQTGLESVGGAPKPLYHAWPIPLVVSKLGRGFSLWGLVRPAAGATHVTILVRTRGSKRYRVLKTATTESMGYWNFVSSVAGVSWKVSWTSPTGVKYEGPPVGATPAP